MEVMRKAEKQPNFEFVIIPTGLSVEECFSGVRNRNEAALPLLAEGCIYLWGLEK